MKSASSRFHSWCISAFSCFPPKVSQSDCDNVTETTPAILFPTITTEFNQSAIKEKMFRFLFFVIFFSILYQKGCKGLTWIFYGNVCHLKLFI